MTLWLVRHAKARSRRDWPGADTDRPLDASGLVTAEMLAERLCGEPISQVLSSPAVRCQQTVAPLAHRLAILIELHEALAEGAAATGAYNLVRQLAGVDTNVVLCSHGDVIPTLLDDLARDGVQLGQQRGCAKGSIWQLDIEAGTVVGAHYIERA